MKNLMINDNLEILKLYSIVIGIVHKKYFRLRFSRFGIFAPESGVSIPVSAALKCRLPGTSRANSGIAVRDGGTP